MRQEGNRAQGIRSGPILRDVYSIGAIDISCDDSAIARNVRMKQVGTEKK